MFRGFMKASIWALVGLVFWAVNAASAQHYDTYPSWVAERFCADWANQAACQSQLQIEDLNSGDPNGQFPRITMCVYEHPSQPWNYTDECFFTTRATAFEQITRIGVKNGSSVTLRHVFTAGGGANAGDVFLNGTPARALEHIGYSCVRTLASGEIFCQLPPPERHVSSLEGSCRINGLGPEALENCRRERICQEIPFAGESACTSVYIWAAGGRTNMTFCEDTPCTINGHDIFEIKRLTSAWNGEYAVCATDSVTGQEFCFSEVPLTP